MKFIDFPEINFPVQGIEEVPMPKMVRIREKYEADKIEDIKAHLEGELDNIELDRDSLKGKSIAITVGSRGIPHLPLMIRTICDKLKEWGAKPFIIPAMGSHGGGTAEGNLEVINGYGITEEAMGVPIKASMDVVLVGQMDDAAKTPIYCDKYAAEADGIVLFNKVKPHTDFKGYNESGICKMIAIGIAKHIGCSWFHKQGFDTFGERIPIVAKEFLSKMNVVMGIGVVQNAYDEISEIMAFPKDKIMEGDHMMLEIAKKRLPRFKFDNIDVLVIDRIGKNISGEGMDPNITGTFATPYASGGIKAQKRAILRLTEQTHGNAHGLGLVDVISKKFYDDMDLEITYPNSITSTVLEFSKIPMIMINDRETFQLCIKTCTEIDREKVRLIRIKNTLDLEYIYVSEGMLDEVRNNPNLEIAGEPEELIFDSDGNLNI